MAVFIGLVPDRWIKSAGDLITLNRTGCSSLRYNSQLMALFTGADRCWFGYLMTLETTAQVYSGTPVSWIYSSRHK